MSGNDLIAEYEKRQSLLDGCLRLYISADLVEKQILDGWIANHRRYLQEKEDVYKAVKIIKALI